MVETLLHAGQGHANLLWILVPSYLTFMLGIVVGMYSDRLRQFVTGRETKTAE
ncbi:hypothetical protein HALLA_15410 [Halostagnicola larsenii XH-48]|uniref:Uncharacterized protein n=1 Tax=Halostagnicola larsenii XH-48 TaxID=797299 RepID=W0JS16_9EURY|nr:hypothetical protein [Halostagnicola larsenii]AHF99974.1 hypothetical protein HALLA_15410 [Halostagnicola larsenii XH-48]